MKTMRPIDHIEWDDEERFSPIYWLSDDELKSRTLAAQYDPDCVSGIDPGITQHGPDPLASHPSDNVIELFTPYSPPPEQRSAWRSFGKGCLALALWLGLAVAVILLLAGVNPMELMRAWL